MDDRPIDLSVLDPQRHPGFEQTVSRVAQRAIELRRLRRAVVRRGLTALAFAMAAAVALWMAAPRRPAQAPRTPDVLDWALRDDVGARDVLELGGGHAQ